jgi:hypothetical protein
MIPVRYIEIPVTSPSYRKWSLGMWLKGCSKGVSPNQAEILASLHSASGK